MAADVVGIVVAGGSAQTAVAEHMQVAVMVVQDIVEHCSDLQVVEDQQVAQLEPARSSIARVECRRNHLHPRYLYHLARLDDDDVLRPASAIHVHVVLLVMVSTSSPMHKEGCHYL